jgi:hypothetical protein
VKEEVAPGVVLVGWVMTDGGMQSKVSLTYQVVLLHTGHLVILMLLMIAAMGGWPEVEAAAMQALLLPVAEVMTVVLLQGPMEIVIIAGCRHTWQERAETGVHKTVAMVQVGPVGAVTRVVTPVIQGPGMTIQVVETGLIHLKDYLEVPRWMFLVGIMHMDTAKEV